jgi:hypothetical protein
MTTRFGMLGVLVANGMPLTRNRSNGGLNRNLLVGKLRNVGSLAGVLNGDPAGIAAPVKVKDRVLIEVFGFSHLDSAKLNV